MNRATTFGYSTSDTETSAVSSVEPIGRYILRSLCFLRMTVVLGFAELSLCTVCFYPTILNNLFGNHLHCQDDKDSYNNDVVELTKYRYKIRNDVERHKYVTHCKPEEIPCQLRGPVVF